MTVATGNLTAWMSEFVAAGTPPDAARERGARGTGHRRRGADV